MEQSLEIKDKKPEEKKHENELLDKPMYSMKEFSKLTGLTEHTIRGWEDEFNIQIARTKPEGGQRRFTRKNLQLYKEINHRLHELGWSVKQVRSWLNGETDPVLEAAEIQSNMEKKLELLQETVNQLVEAEKTRDEKMKLMMETIIQQRDENVMLQLRTLMNEKQQTLLENKNEIEKENFISRLKHAFFPKKKPN